MYELAERRLGDAGYEHYEISNWARPGRACQHNLTYWHNLPYIGLGAGAHGWYAGQRYSEAHAVGDYVTRVEAAMRAEADMAQLQAVPGAAVVASEPIARELEMAETAMLGLRLTEGVDLKRFAARFGIPFDTVFGTRLADVTALGLAEYGDDRLRLTERGRLLGNEVFQRVLPD
jgi:oxygen-independent coproporphyrinogen-3 oxidase